jgi:pimeloyl-ACP methyl ester carboxylesterase
MGGHGSVWYETLEYVAEPVEALVYNRAGIGASDLRPEPKTLGYLARAEELGRLVDAIGFATPAVFVGHSIGGLIVRLFASMRPTDVAGLVLVECSLDGLRLLPTDTTTQEDGAELLDAALGERELLCCEAPDVPAAVVSRRPGVWPDQVYYDTPGTTERWTANQWRLVDELHAEHYVSEFAGHMITEEDPQLIARAVDEVVRKARDGR